MGVKGNILVFLLVKYLLALHFQKLPSFKAEFLEFLKQVLHQTAQMYRTCSRALRSLLFCPLTCVLQRGENGFISVLVQFILFFLGLKM